MERRQQEQTGGSMMASSVYFDDVQEGSELPAIEMPAIHKGQLVQYAGASHDYNLLHTDDDFARKAGMPNGVIALRPGRA
jgi:acyl dehydratase